MRDPTFQSPRGNFKYGMRMLRKKLYGKALRHFRKAVESCSVQDRFGLAGYLYWLGITLGKLGKPELSLKSYVSSQKLVRRGFARRLYLRMTNGYGMLKRSSTELDDFYAYSSIQIARYLERKTSRRFSDEFEKESVTAIITQMWKKLSDGNCLKGKTTGQKIILFQKLQICFPIFVVSSERGNIITGNFPKNTCHLPDDRCVCGSGLPYRLCCGRLACTEELDYGYF
jgi:hypothetical protein